MRWWGNDGLALGQHYETVGLNNNSFMMFNDGKYHTEDALFGLLMIEMMIFASRRSLRHRLHHKIFLPCYPIHSGLNHTLLFWVMQWTSHHSYGREEWACNRWMMMMMMMTMIDNCSLPLLCLYYVTNLEYHTPAYSGMTASTSTSWWMTSVVLVSTEHHPYLPSLFTSLHHRNSKRRWSRIKIRESVPTILLECRLYKSSKSLV